MTLSASQLSPTQIATAKLIFSTISEAFGPLVGVAAVVNAFAESSFRVDAVGDHDKSFSLWQEQSWQVIYAKTGIDVRHAGVADQCKATIWVLQHLEQESLNEIVAAKTYEDATRAWCSSFERPGAKNQADIRVAEIPVFIQVLGLS